MKKLFVFYLAALLLISAVAFAREEKNPLAAYKSGKMWHFIDENGNELFPPMELSNVLGYSEGLILVSVKKGRKDKWGYLNLDGEFVIEPQFDNAKFFKNGRALVYTFGNSGEFPILLYFIDKHGRRLFNEGFIDALDFSENKAFVMRPDRSSAYIDTSGKVLFELNGHFGGYFSEGKASVTNLDYVSGFINDKGEQIIDFKYNNVGKFSSGLAPVYFEIKYGYINENDSLIIDNIYDYAHEFIEDRAFAGYSNVQSLKTRWVVIDKDGNEIGEQKFPQKMNFSEGLAAVRNKDAWGFIDKDCEYVIDPDYFYCASFINGLGWATTSDKSQRGYIDKDGDYVIEINDFDKLIDLRLNKKMF